jgi:IS30 family transposase
MARRYTLAERAELSYQAYRDSSYGMSGREIGKELGIDHKTAIKLVREEAERRRDEESHDFQKACDTYKTIIRRCREELDSSPSDHAVSQPSTSRRERHELL